MSWVPSGQRHKLVWYSRQIGVNWCVQMIQSFLVELGNHSAFLRVRVGPELFCLLQAGWRQTCIASPDPCILFQSVLHCFVKEVWQLTYQLIGVIVEIKKLLGYLVLTLVNVLRVKFWDPIGYMASLEQQKFQLLLFLCLIFFLQDDSLLDILHDYDGDLKYLFVHNVYTLHLHFKVFLIRL